MYEYYIIEKQERLCVFSVQKLKNNATIKHGKKLNIHQA